MLSRQDNNFKEKKAITTFGQLILPLTIVIALGLLFFSVKLFFYTPMNPDNGNIMEEESKQIEKMIKDKQGNTPTAVKGKVIIIKENNAASQNKAEKKGATNTKKEEEYISINLAKPIKKGVTSQRKAEDASTVNVITKPAGKKSQPAVKKETKTIGTHIPESAQKETKEFRNNATESEKKRTVNQKKEKGKQPENATGAKTEKQTQSKTISKVKRWDVQIGGFSDKKNAEQFMQKAKDEGYKVYLEEGTSNKVPYYKIRVHGGEDKEKADKLSKDLSSKGYPVYLIAIE